MPEVIGRGRPERTPVARFGILGNGGNEEIATSKENVMKVRIPHSSFFTVLLVTTARRRTNIASAGPSTASMLSANHAGQRSAYWRSVRERPLVVESRDGGRPSVHERRERTVVRNASTRVRQARGEFYVAIEALSAGRRRAARRCERALMTGARRGAA